MPETIVYLTRREHHELMLIAKMVQAAPARICFWAMASTMMLFTEHAQLPMLPRPNLQIPRSEFRGYRRVRVMHDEWERGYLAAIAEQCRVSKDYIARLSVTQFIASVYRDGIAQGWVDMFREELSLETAPLRPDRHAGSHLVPGGPLSTLEERNPPNPRADN